MLTSDGWVESGVILKPRKKGVDEINGISQSGGVYKGNIVDEMVVAWVNIWDLYLAVDFLTRYVLEKELFTLKNIFTIKYSALISNLQFWVIKAIMPMKW